MQTLLVSKKTANLAKNLQFLYILHDLRNRFPLWCFYLYFQSLSFRTMIFIKLIFSNAHYHWQLLELIYDFFFFPCLHFGLCLIGF